jgi:hypothetical protein
MIITPTVAIMSPAAADTSDRPSTVQSDRSGRPAIHPIIVRPFSGIVRFSKSVATTTTTITVTTPIIIIGKNGSTNNSNIVSGSGSEHGRHSQ